MTKAQCHYRPERRKLLLATIALGLTPLSSLAAIEPVPMTVWKDPNCGCCADWVTHLEGHGFVVKVLDSGNSAVRSQLGLPQKYASCHTAVTQGYVIEGHVPASDIHRLLKERPPALGLAVPGMPIGSPGMDGPAYGGRSDRYAVLLVEKNGTASVFSAY
jgi:hypothetical protein